MATYEKKIMVSVNEEQKKQLQRAADAAAVPLSVWARYLLLKASGIYAPPLVAQVPDTHGDVEPQTQTQTQTQRRRLGQPREDQR